MSQLSQVKLSKPKHKDIIPSTGEKVTLSPFRVGDEKVLLLASESNEVAKMADAMIEVISNCVEPVNTDELASFDLEYLFVKLRSISVGESVKLPLKCSECEEVNKTSVDLSKVSVKKDENHTNIIKVEEGQLGFEMSYPKIDVTAEVDENDFDGILALISDSIKTVYWGDETIVVGEAEKEDMLNIINQLTTKQFAKVQEFFTTMPKLSETVKFKCVKCETDNKITLEGMKSFF